MCFLWCPLLVTCSTAASYPDTEPSMEIGIPQTTAAHLPRDTDGIAFRTSSITRC